MAQLLRKQDNFQLQKSQVEKIITQRGHLCIFLLKFHCELNPIEMVCFHSFLLLCDSQSVQYWGWYKHQYREHYKDTFVDAKKIARECLDMCPVEVIRHFF